jgi:hypothetical protein
VLSIRQAIVPVVQGITGGDGTTSGLRRRRGGVVFPQKMIHLLEGMVSPAGQGGRKESIDSFAEIFYLCTAEARGLDGGIATHTIEWNRM